MARVILFILFLYSAIEYSFGQAPFFQHYSLTDSNEPLQINKIFQDKVGFMWFGTDKGLFKYDGVNYQHYTLKQGLPEESVTAIAQDLKGTIWLGHKSGLISFFEGNHIKKFDPPEGHSSQEISDILFDNAGNLWFSTLNDGLYYFYNDRLHRLDEMDGMPDLFIYDLEKDKDGNIWAGSDEGITICSLKNSKVTLQVLDKKNGLQDNVIRKIIIPKNNLIWMSTEDSGIIQFDLNSQKSTPLIDSWKYGSVNDFLITSTDVWISSDKGLFTYNLATKSIEIYNNNLEFGTHSIRVLFEDVESSIWLGTSEFLLRTPGNFIEYINESDFRMPQNINAITIDDENNIWYSANGILFKRSTDGLGVVKVQKPLANTIFGKYEIISLYADSIGYVWAGLFGQGVLMINRASGKTVHINKELSNGNVLSITGKKNVIWLATLGGAARIQVNDQNFSVQNYSQREGLASDYIYQVFVDSKNRVWFSFDGRGVDMLDKKDIHHFQNELDQKVAFGFTEDIDQNIWVNVQNIGLYKYDGVGFQLMQSSKSGSIINKVNCFTSDRYGHLVAMHDFGIDVYDISERKTEHLGSEVGINNRKPNLNAVAKDRNGNIYFGTTNGIIKYSRSDNERQTLPQPLIENVNIAHRKIDMDQSIELSYRQNFISFNYLGLWFKNSGSLHFLYKLENFDNDWIASLNRSAVYSELPPGEYTFKLLVSETEDFDGAKEASFSFKVNPPFWKTLWFYLMTGCITLISLIAIIKFREKNITNDKRILEARVVERTIEIQNKKEEINAQAEKIKAMNENLEVLVYERTKQLETKNKALEEYAFITAHQLRAPLASILGLVNLVSKIKVASEEKIMIDYLKDSANKLDDIIRSMTKAIEKGDF